MEEPHIKNFHNWTPRNIRFQQLEGIPRLSTTSEADCRAFSGFYSEAVSLTPVMDAT